MSPERSVRAGRYAGPPGDDTVYYLPRDMRSWEKAWDVHLPAVAGEEEGGRREVDMSPEAVAERARRKKLHAEAIAFVRDYTGTFGLILDIRANPKWGTKYLRLSDRQVDAVLASRDRDLARAKAAAEAPRHPRYDEAIAEIARAGAYSNASDFVVSLGLQVARGQQLSDRQVEAVLRNAPAKVVDEPGFYRGGHSEVGDPDGFTVPAPPAPITEGMYKLPDGTIAKVQKAVHGSGNLYAKRLVVEEGSTAGRFDYVPGLISRIRPDDRMSLDEASAFGQLYGWCCVCGRTLTDEKSIAAGIGPVCAANV